MTTLATIFVLIMGFAVITMLIVIFTLMAENKEYEIENSQLKIALEVERMKSKLYQDLLDQAIEEDK